MEKLPASAPMVLHIATVITFDVYSIVLLFYTLSLAVKKPSAKTGSLLAHNGKLISLKRTSSVADVVKSLNLRGNG